METGLSPGDSSGYGRKGWGWGGANFGLRGTGREWPRLGSGRGLETRRGERDGPAADPAWDPAEGARLGEPGAGLRSTARVGRRRPKLVQSEKVPGNNPESERARQVCRSRASRTRCAHPRTHVRTHTGCFEKGRRERD